MYIQKYIFVFIAISLTSLLTGGGIYKWVDDEGKVHYGDKPPKQIENQEIHVIPDPSKEETQRARQEVEQLLEDMEKRDKIRQEEMAKNKDKPSETDTAIQDEPLSLEELDRRCEAAREKKIAPLREKAIQECLAEEHTSNTREDCEKINNSIGQAGYCDSCGPMVKEVYAGGGYRAQGRPIPPMFYDLPECEAAFKAHKEIEQ